MGEIADGLIDGSFDSITGEYLGEGSGFPRTRSGKKRKKTFYKRTPVEKKIASIRKEIAIDINENGIEQDEARRKANLKYGKGWRERGLFANSDNQWTEEELAPFK